MENDYQINSMQNFRFQELMSNFVAKKLHENEALLKRLSRYPTAYVPSVRQFGISLVRKQTALSFSYKQAVLRVYSPKSNMQ